MIEITVRDMPHIAPLFAAIEETMIDSCLQGHMGRAWADRLPHPTAACVMTGDFCCFAGDAGSTDALLLVRNTPQYGGEFLILVPPDNRWAALIEQVHARRYYLGERYATHKDPAVFDREHLLALRAQLPEGYALQRIDDALYAQVMDSTWARDLCSQFADAADYAARGLGRAAVRDGQICAGASSYTIYDRGIEIEVDTAPAHRRRGLATSCCAALMLDCLERGLYPSWDAASKASLQLAEKLGYHFSHAYPVYFLQKAVKRLTSPLCAVHRGLQLVDKVDKLHERDFMDGQIAARSARPAVPLVGSP